MYIFFLHFNILKCGSPSSCSWPPLLYIYITIAGLLPDIALKFVLALHPQMSWTRPLCFVLFSYATFRVPMAMLMQIEALLHIQSFFLTISCVFCGHKQLHTRHMCGKSHTKLSCLTTRYLTQRCPLQRNSHTAASVRPTVRFPPEQSTYCVIHRRWFIGESELSF